VEELFTNSVRHEDGRVDPITLELRVGDREIVITYSAPGDEPFDITTVPPVDPDRPVNDIRPGGLGLHLVHAVMDDVKYSFSHRVGTVTLIKRLE
jgi:anti-sigma regulatory factor (Ser/Thr protein kinase)